MSLFLWQNTLSNGINFDDYDDEVYTFGKGRVVEFDDEAEEDEDGLSEFKLLPSKVEKEQLKVAKAERERDEKLKDAAEEMNYLVGLVYEESSVEEMKEVTEDEDDEIKEVKI